MISAVRFLQGVRPLWTWTRSGLSCVVCHSPARKSQATRACVARSGAGTGTGGRVAASAPALGRSACHSPLLFHSTTPPFPLPPRASRWNRRRLEREDRAGHHRMLESGVGIEAGRGEGGRGRWRWAWCSTARSSRWIWRWPRCRWRWRSPSSPSSPPCSAPRRSSTTPSPPRRLSRHRRAATSGYARVSRFDWVHFVATRLGFGTNSPALSMAYSAWQWTMALGAMFLNCSWEREIIQEC